MKIIFHGEKILRELERIGQFFRSAEMLFINDEGEVIEMDLSAKVTDKPAVAVFTEFDGPNGTGNQVPPVGKVTFTSSDPTVATVDPGTGQLAYLKAGSTVIAASDSGNNIAASGTVTLTAAAVAQSATMTFAVPA